MEKESVLLLIENFLLSSYEPVESLRDATMTMPTYEIWERMAEHFGTAEIVPEDVADLLLRNGYRYEDIGSMNVEWLLKKI